MLKLSSKIVITAERRYEIDYLTEVEITRDMESLTGTCRITFPKRVKWDNSTTLPLRRGDKVLVYLGYNDQLELAFAGYIRDISHKTPVTLTCEDEMYRLKLQAAQAKTYRNVDLETLLSDQQLPCPVEVFGEQNIGAYRVTAATVAALLGHLHENGIRSFFRYDEQGNPTLYCGVLFEQQSQQAIQHFSSGDEKANIIDDSNLQVQKAEDMRIHIRAISLMPDNKKIKIDIGDHDGERRTLHTYNKTEAELRAWAEQEMKRLRRDGLTGSFTTFGSRLLHTLEHISLRIDDKEQGIYQVKKNIINFSHSGYRQEITLL